MATAPEDRPSPIPASDTDPKTPLPSGWMPEDPREVELDTPQGLIGLRYPTPTPIPLSMKDPMSPKSKPPAKLLPTEPDPPPPPPADEQTRERAPLRLVYLVAGLILVAIGCAVVLAFRGYR